MTMTRRSRTSTRLARRLRPSPAGFAAAAAVHDPSLLMALQAAQADTGRGAGAALTSPCTAR
jgi:hypothetical protein